MLVYHYTNGQSLFNIIKSNTLFCSRIDFMNDLSENDYYKSCLGKLLESEPRLNEIYEQFHNSSYNDAMYNYNPKFVASFSKNSDSLSMWNYYSEGNGYCIGLNVDEVLKSNQIPNSDIKKIDILYEESRQREEISNYIKEFQGGMKRFKKELSTYQNGDGASEAFYKADQYLDETIRKFNDGLQFVLMRMKHPSFDREEEYRLLTQIDESQGGGDTGFRVTNKGVMIEYLRLKLNLKKSLKSVTVHPTATSVQLEGVKNFIGHYLGNNVKKEVAFKSSEIPFREL